MENVQESFKFELSIFGREKSEIFNISEWDIEPEAWVSLDEQERRLVIEEKLEEWKKEWMQVDLDRWLSRCLEVSYE